MNDLPMMCEISYRYVTEKGTKSKEQVPVNESPFIFHALFFIYNDMLV